MSSVGKRKRYIFDLVLIVLILSVFLSVYFFIQRNKQKGAVAEVYIGDELAATYPLDKDGEYSVNGGSNVLKIEDGKAYMTYANCPDGWCKHQGKISRSGERITCLPNKVMVMIKEQG